MERRRTAAEILSYLTDINTDDSDGGDSDGGNSDNDNSDDEENVVGVEENQEHEEDRYLADNYDLYTPSDDEPVMSEDDESEADDEIEADENEGIDETLLDRSAKDDYVWKIMKEGEEKRTRNRVKFNGKGGPSLHAIGKVEDESALSVYRLLMEDLMLDNIVLHTNENCAAKRPEIKFRIVRNDLLAFIAVQYCRGLYCGGVAVDRLWSKDTGIPIIKELMSRNKFRKIMR